MSLAATLLVAVSLVALAGCSSDQPLEGTAWKLVGSAASSFDPAGVTITAEFADGQVKGKSAVNHYGGPYKLGPGDAFSVGQIASTLTGGSEAQLRAESDYWALLGQARSYKEAGGKLTLYDEGGNELLIFERTSK